MFGNHWNDGVSVVRLAISTTPVPPELEPRVYVSEGGFVTIDLGSLRTPHLKTLLSPSPYQSLHEQLFDKFRDPQLVNRGRSFGEVVIRNAHIQVGHRL